MRRAERALCANNLLPPAIWLLYNALPTSRYPSTPITQAHYLASTSLGLIHNPTPRATPCSAPTYYGTWVISVLPPRSGMTNGHRGRGSGCALKRKNYARSCAATLQLPLSYISAITVNASERVSFCGRAARRLNLHEQRLTRIA